jgi:hypothetical protein
MRALLRTGAGEGERGGGRAARATSFFYIFDVSKNNVAN